MEGWNARTAAIAISCGIMAAIEGERQGLRVVMGREEIDARLVAIYGFSPEPFERSPTTFPATRAVVDMVAYLCQKMAIPHEHYETFLERHVESGSHNPISKVQG